jgi:tetratricopeptide (TPR) repeat protein
MQTGLQIANRFRISDPEQDLIGRGGMGEVYRATDLHTDDLVAVKALSSAAVARDPEILERFVHEGQALRQLNHPNIVRMITAVEEAGQHYLVMEYMPGGSLADLLEKQKCLPTGQVMEIALDLADALTRAHRLGIIHRDLKPANVLLAEDGSPRLSDFGIAHMAESPRLTQTGVLVGTVDYLSPEVCQGERSDERADIWAFGVMLFQLLTGRLPFEGKTLTAKISAILTQPVPDVARLVPETPPALADLIGRMLEKEPERRIPSVRQVAIELESILKGRKPPTPLNAPAAISIPSFLGEEEVVVSAPGSTFVTRQGELEQLDRFLNRALSGQGQVAFISGDPGQGKTTLAQEFAWRAQKKYPDLVVADGNCNAYTGIGDPYLPFREIMALFSGEGETRGVVQANRREQLRRLWLVSLLTAQALVESGPDLIDVFVGGTTLIQHVKSVLAHSMEADWVPRLEQLVEHKRSATTVSDLKQAALFEQYVRVMRALAAQKPLLLLLDDLQWADSGSINLLFHLVRGIPNSRIMLLGAYRPAEVSLGRGGEQHPLLPVLNEFKSKFGSIEIDLRQAEGQEFVDAILDTEPNRLGSQFRQTLCHQTGGHALATVEMLRDLQENGGLIKDKGGCWVEGPNLNWDSLPVRVEAMIAQRIERLDAQERRLLQVASVEGEVFTSEVAARVLSSNQREVVSLLSGDLDRLHHLVRGHGARQVNGQRLSSYRFQHILFQRYLYNSLDPVERSQIHLDVAAALQELYGENNEDIAVQLARHFKEGGAGEKAAAYLDQAGDRAKGFYAQEEAVESYQQAMSAYQNALGERWDPLQKAELEIKIGEALYLKGEHRPAIEHLEKALAYLGYPMPRSAWGVHLEILIEIMRQCIHRLLPSLFTKVVGTPASPKIEATTQSYLILGWIQMMENSEKFLLIALKNLNFSERYGYPDGIVQAAAGMAVVADFVFLYRLASYYFRMTLSILKKIERPNPVSKGGPYGGIQVHHIFQGMWDESLEYGREAARIFLEANNIHFWMAPAHYLGLTDVYRGNFPEALKGYKEMVRLGTDRADPQLKCWGLGDQGFTQQRLGQLDEAIHSLREAGELAEAVPDVCFCISVPADLGRVYLRQGRLKEGLESLEKGQRRFVGNLGGDSYASLRNGMAEACLKMAERSVGKERSLWLKKAGRACRTALKQKIEFVPGLPEALRLQGTYEWLRGKPAAAQQCWQRGLELAEKMGQRYDTGMAHLEMGRRLGARAHLEQAEALFAQIGAEWDLARAREALSKSA